jgi:Spy/CpxP family protein refolding chaperone
MNKLIPVIAACSLAATSLLAGNPHDGATRTQNEGDGYRMACSVPTRSLNLTDDQRKKVSEVMSAHHKTGCSAASEAEFVQQMKGILTAEQFAKFNATYEAGPKMKM